MHFEDGAPGSPSSQLFCLSSSGQKPCSCFCGEERGRQEGKAKGQAQAWGLRWKDILMPEPQTRAPRQGSSPKPTKVGKKDKEERHAENREQNTWA